MMKNNSTKKLLALFLGIFLLITCIIPVYAVENYGSFSGRITSPTGVDLSGIEIQVYSAVPIYDDSSAGKLLYYAETYEYSVYTNDDGYFLFNKPTQYCSISINLNSIPQNYGISKQTQFIVPANEEIELSLSIVDRVDVTMTDGEIIPTIYNTENEKILANYTVIPSNGQIITSTIGTSSKALSLEAVNAVSAYRNTGKVKIGSELYSYTIVDDWSMLSLVEKIDVLFDKDYLSESERISLYCDLLTNDNEFVLQSGTTIYQEILKFKSKNDITIESELSRKIQAASTRATPPYTNYIDTTIGTYTIRVFYDTSENMEYSVVSNFVSECRNVYNFFVTTNGFKAPIPYDGTNYYPIYLVTDEYLSSLGLTTSNTSTGASKIYVRYSEAAGSASDYKVTLSHEFNHAVMSAYSCMGAERWFKESFSSMMALVYNGSSTSWYSYYVPQYLTRSYYSISSSAYTGIAYGALMYPLYIYTNLGGLPAIRSIYAEYSDAGNPYDAITNSAYVSNYRYAFLASVSRNYKPVNYYTYATSAWGTGSINDFTIPFASTTNMGVNPMACHYQRFSSSSNIGTAYFTIEITSADGSGLMLNKITETSTGTLSIGTVSTNFSRITVQQANFGSTVKKLTLIPVNTNKNGTAITYKLTAST